MKLGDIINAGEGESVVVRRIYNLYLRKFGRVQGLQRYAARGKCIGSFARYKDLVAEAHRRTIAAGYPKSRWMDLYDWNEGAR